jgi:hypothetical protein
MNERTVGETDMTNQHQDDCVKSVVKYTHVRFNI